MLIGNGLGDVGDSTDWTSIFGGGSADTTTTLQIPGQVTTSPTLPGSGVPLTISQPGTDWLSVLNNAIGGASKIFQTRYAVPQLNPGQYISTSPSGASTMYQLAPGQTSGFPSLTSLGSSGMMPILLLGGGVLLLLAMKK